MIESKFDLWCLFNSNGDEVGRFYIKDKELFFSGSFDDTTKILFEQYLRPKIDEYIKESRKRGPYKRRKIDVKV